MDHLAYYDLKEEPFAVMPLTKFYYHNDQHDQAFLRLKRVADGMKGLGVCVGDVGTGKTLLARRLFESLPDDQFECAMLVVLHGDVTGDWLIRRIAGQLGVEDLEGSKVDVLTRLYDRLNVIADDGRRAVIIIDEAHMLRKQEVLEELRGLLNLELSDAKLITFIMFGMLPLDECLLSEPALKQRIAVRCELKNLPENVLIDYVRFRLFHAGSAKQVFAIDALTRIHLLSKGNPRLVNVICDNALFEGFVRKAELPLPVEIIDAVGEDLRLPPAQPADEPAERR